MSDSEKSVYADKRALFIRERIREAKILIDEAALMANSTNLINDLHNINQSLYIITRKYSDEIY